MSITVNEQNKLFTIATKNSGYQMKVDNFGFLHHLHYGKPIGGTDMSYMYYNYDRGFAGNPYEARYTRGFSLDTFGQEYTSYGVGDYRVNSIAAENADGSRCVDLRYVGYEIKSGKYALAGLPAMYDNGGEAETLVITLADQVSKLTVKLYYGVFSELDIITRAVEITNNGGGDVIIEKASSACLDIPFGRWDLIQFHGRHLMERQPERSPIGHSIQTVSSTRGMSSHHHNPFVIICDRDANEDGGECYGMMLVYSGNHKTEAELDQLDSARIVMGINDDHFTWTLTPGQTFTAPEVIMTYTDGGFTALSHIYHRAIRNNICRGKYKTARRPVLINSWEANYFDFNEDSLIQEAKLSADMGVELFVLDDGWFGTRNDDNSGLGDWTVNLNKLPNGLSGLADKINDLGMKFGLWIEPEMVNEDSNLYRTHPDWALAAPNRKPMLGRNQLVLDMSRSDVRDYLYDAISTLLRENNIEYIKWDFNRPVSDVYSGVLPADRQGEVSHRFVLGTYELMDRLTTDFPDVLFEGCAGGGGRFDAGIMYYSPQIWLSDDTDPIERLKIQRGSSFAYPVSTYGSHVSASPNHQTGRTTPLQTRAVVAMSGTFGYELDPTTLTREERDQIRHQIANFKSWYELIQRGLYYRLTAPDGSHYWAWQFVSPDKSESLLSMVVTHTLPNAPLIHVRMKGLDPKGIYRNMTDGKQYTGAALMYGGCSFPLMLGDYSAVQWHFKKIGSEE